MNPENYNTKNTENFRKNLQQPEYRRSKRKPKITKFKNPEKSNSNNCKKVPKLLENSVKVKHEEFRKVQSKSLKVPENPEKRNHEGLHKNEKMKGFSKAPKNNTRKFPQNPEEILKQLPKVPENPEK